MKSKYKKLAGKEEKEAFERAHATVLTETHTLWHLSQVFLVANTFLAGFIGTNFKDINTTDNKIGFFLISIIGFIISVLWFFSYSRISNYYKFRIAQAKQREPEGWMLYKEDSYFFSEGIKINIDDRSYGLGIGKLSNLWILKLLPVVFGIFYSIVAYMSFPWA